MATKEKGPLAGISVPQLRLVEVLQQHPEARVAITESLQSPYGVSTWRVRSPRAEVQAPAKETGELKESHALGGAIFGSTYASRGRLASVAVALRSKGVLVELAVAHDDSRGNPANPKDSQYGRREALYVLAPAVSGQMVEALEEARAKEQAARARAAAWEAARAPLDEEDRRIVQEFNQIRSGLRRALDHDTPEALVNAHRRWRELAVQLADLNGRLTALARAHGGRKPDLYELPRY